MLTSEQDLEGAGTCADTDVAIPVYHAVEGHTGVAGDTLVVGVDGDSDEVFPCRCA